MSEIGNNEHAGIILAWVRANPSAFGYDMWGMDPVDAEFPTGWRYLATGSFRHVFISPDGVVYKVDRLDNENPPFEEGEENFVLYTNYGEWEGIQNIRISGAAYPGWRIADTTAYHVGNEIVLAMECVRGRWDESYSMRGIHEVEEAFELADIHCENYVVLDSGERVLIDVTPGYI